METGIGRAPEDMNSQQTRSEMNKMYQFTRHIYDMSRKYFLLGRDRLINNVNIKPGEHICEIGCGTARNIIKLAQKYPGAVLFGIDASDEMLKSAQKSLHRAKVDAHIAQAYAQSFNPEQTFGDIEPFKKIIFSYSLSIIPPWEESLDHALKLLPTAGEIHIVDFYNMAGFPRPAKKCMYWFLSKFHVYYKPEILEYLKKKQNDGVGILEYNEMYKGYAYYATFVKTAS